MREPDRSARHRLRPSSFQLENRRRRRLPPKRLRNPRRGGQYGTARRRGRALELGPRGLRRFRAGSLRRAAAGIPLAGLLESPRLGRCGPRIGMERDPAVRRRHPGAVGLDGRLDRTAGNGVPAAAQAFRGGGYGTDAPAARRLAGLPRGLCKRPQGLRPGARPGRVGTRRESPFRHLRHHVPARGGTERTGRMARSGMVSPRHLPRRIDRRTVRERPAGRDRPGGSPHAPRQRHIVAGRRERLCTHPERDVAAPGFRRRMRGRQPGPRGPDTGDARRTHVAARRHGPAVRTEDLAPDVRAERRPRYAASAIAPPRRRQRMGRRHGPRVQRLDRTAHDRTEKRAAHSDRLLGLDERRRIVPPAGKQLQLRGPLHRLGRRDGGLPQPLRPPRLPIPPDQGAGRRTGDARGIRHPGRLCRRFDLRVLGHRPERHLRHGGIYAPQSGFRRLRGRLPASGTHGLRRRRKRLVPHVPDTFRRRAALHELAANVGRLHPRRRRNAPIRTRPEAVPTGAASSSPPRGRPT